VTSCPTRSSVGRRRRRGAGITPSACRAIRSYARDQPRAGASRPSSSFPGTEGAAVAVGGRGERRLPRLARARTRRIASRLPPLHGRARSLHAGAGGPRPAGDAPGARARLGGRHRAAVNFGKKPALGPRQGAATCARSTTPSCTGGTPSSRACSRGLRGRGVATTRSSSSPRITERSSRSTGHLKHGSHLTTRCWTSRRDRRTRRHARARDGAGGGRGPRHRGPRASSASGAARHDWYQPAGRARGSRRSPDAAGHRPDGDVRDRLVRSGVRLGS
jgi:hypothetical protein